MNNDEANKKLSIKQNMLWNSIGSLTYLGCQWLITIFVVRLSESYESAGVLSLAMSVYNIFAPLAIYRMYTYQVSDVKKENSAGEYLSFRILTCAISLVLIVAYAALTCPLTAFPAILLYSASKIISLVIDVLHGADQINGRMDYIGRSLIAQGFGTLLSFCVTFEVTKSLEAACLAMAIATLAIGFAYDLPRTRQFEPIIFGITRKKAFHLLGYCFPIVLAAVACSAAPSIPRQLLALINGESALGIYASIAAPVAIIQMGASYIYNPLLTIFAEHYAKGEQRELVIILVKAAAGIAFVGILAVIGFELFGELVLGLMYGNSIIPYCYLLTPMIICSLCTAFVWFLNDLLVALRCFKGSLAGNIIALLVSAACCLPLINCFGMNGVSFAGIASYAAASLVMVLFLKQTIARNTNRSSSLSEGKEQHNS